MAGVYLTRVKKWYVMSDLVTYLPSRYLVLQRKAQDLGMR